MTLVAIEDSVHVGRALGARRAREDDVSGRIDRARVAADAPGYRYPGRVSRELRRDPVAGGPALAAVGRDPVGGLHEAWGAVGIERLAAAMTVRMRACRGSVTPRWQCALRPCQGSRACHVGENRGHRDCAGRVTLAEVARAEHVGRNLMALRALNRASKRRRRQVQLVLAHPHGGGCGISVQIGRRCR